MIRFACFEFRYVIVHAKVCVGMVCSLKLKKKNTTETRNGTIKTY